MEEIIFGFNDSVLTETRFMNIVSMTIAEKKELTTSKIEDNDLQKVNNF